MLLAASGGGAQMTPTQEWIAAHIDKLVKDKFYGKVTLQLEAGEITTVRNERVIVPSKDDPVTLQRMK
ncbi:MAG: hypothetical protein D4R73_09180 [Deltaproteobacteria bacterium]|nr:MAG: hypothetical protein D4R73_09180 [Deltaproteobacteria bacterium]